VPHTTTQGWRKELLNNKWPDMKEKTVPGVTEMRNLVTFVFRIKCKYKREIW
jgi:hypothetical protein